MKANKLIILLAILFGIFQSSAAFAKSIVINSYVGVEIGADLAQYEDTVGLLRNQTRKMYMNEIVEAAALLSGGYFDPSKLLGPLQKIQESADQKRDINKQIDSVKVGFSVGEFFKSSIEKMHKLNGITKSERIIIFANQFPVINNRMMYNPKVQFSHYVFIQMAHIGRGHFRLSAALGSVASGEEVFYEGEGYLEEAIMKIAEEVFASVMENNRAAWIDPNPKLTWIPGPAGISSLDVREAKIYCQGQNARLPLADELILAHHGTAYRRGGITRFKQGENYFVSDEMRQRGAPYVVFIENYSEAATPKVIPYTGQRGGVWCVKGAISMKNDLIQKLYSLRRKIDPKGVNIRFFPELAPPNSLEGIKAIESILIHLNAAGAELDDTLSLSDLMDLEEAQAIVKELGLNIKSWP